MSRNPIARLLDVWRLGPGFAAPNADVWLRTRDNVPLAGSLLGGDARPAIVVAHGFGAHRRKTAYVRLAERLAVAHTVLSLDLRGHGQSRGRSTLGDREALDLRAAAGWLRARGHDWVGVVGTSMGGTAALRCAAGPGPGPFDAVCAISAPAEFVSNGSPPVRALSTMVTSTTWRMVVERALRVRVARGWGDPADPVRLADRVTPTPLLLVHGVDDHYFTPDHGERLRAAAGAHAVLWVEPDGFGHAEDGFRDAFLDRIAVAAATCRMTGRWPAQPERPRDGEAGVVA